MTMDQPSATPAATNLTTTDRSIVAEGLVKDFGDLRAVDHVDLEIPSGQIFGFLGPNGAGKSTVVKMLTTILRPSAGHATVAGLDVDSQQGKVRRAIGVALQEVGLDPLMTARESLVMQAQLFGASTTDARSLAERLLITVGLDDVDPAKRIGGYSGGMKRRLDLALALAHDPHVLFLDEPTTGLDPRARRALWDVIRAINEAGTTVVLTTHYMEEAERLCARVAVMDHGHVMALDTPRALVHSLGADAHVTFTLSEPLPLAALCGLDGVSSCSAHDGEGYAIIAGNAQRAVVSLLDLAAARGLTVENLDVQGANLEDVFLRMTGRKLADEEEEDERAKEPRKPRRRGFLFGGGG